MVVYVCVSVCGYQTRAFHAEVVLFLPMDGIIMLFPLVASATSLAKPSDPRTVAFHYQNS